jgi:hypothetical protein
MDRTGRGGRIVSPLTTQLQSMRINGCLKGKMVDVAHAKA